MTQFQLILVTNKDEIKQLYEESALTFEGFVLNYRNLHFLVKWFESNDAIINPNRKIRFHIIKGYLMNEVYTLSGDNSYPEALILLSVTGIDQLAIAFEMRKLHGRWMDDIIDNNLRREAERVPINHFLS